MNQQIVNNAYIDGGLNAAAPAEKLTDWKFEPSVSALKDDLLMAEPTQQAQVNQIKRWLDLRNVPSASEQKDAKDKSTRSKIQPKLVRRTNEWRYSALSEPFLSSERPFKISPRTWEDMKGAEQNGTVLGWQIDTKLRWLPFIGEYVRTCVDEGTVAVRTGWELDYVTEKVMVPIWTYFEATSPEEMAALESAAKLKTESPNEYLNLPEDLRESLEYSIEVGQPAIAKATGEQEIEREKILVNQPTVEVIDYENLYIDPTCNGDTDKAKFGIYAFETCKADLLKDKGRYKNLDKVQWRSASSEYEPKFQSRTTPDTQFRDELRRKVVAYEYWGFHDINGDGSLVPIVATWIGNVMVRMELNPYPDQKIPFVLVPYMPIKKSLTGEPDAALVEDNQAVMGALMRGIIDLMGKSANSQTGMAKGMLDAVNKKRYLQGADYEFNPNMPPAASIHTHTYPEIPNSAMNLLAMQNQESEAITGVKAFSGGLSGNAYGDVAAGARAMIDAAAKREMDILRRLAYGVKQILMKILAMNQVFLSEEEVVRITNDQFVTIRREDLAGNFDLMVDVSTPEIEEAKAQKLAFILQTMGPNMDFSITKMVLSEIARLYRMPTLAHSIDKFEPQPDPLDVQIKQLQAAKLQAEIREITSRTVLNGAKAEEAQAKADMTDLNYVHQADGTQHARDIDKQSQQAEANTSLAITDRILDPTQEGKDSDVQKALEYKAFTDLLTNAQ